MLTESSSRISSGIWLTDASGERLGSIKQAIPDSTQPGCVNVEIYAPDPHLIAGGSGDWRVCDERHDVSYCVQALCAVASTDGYRLRVSSLGEPTQVQQEYDEDYLLVEGQAAVRLTGFLTAESEFSQGPHVRCELTAEDLESTGLRFSRPAKCGCTPTAFGLIVANPTVHRWAFADLLRKTSSINASLDTPIDIVRLKQRQTLHCNFYIGLPKTPDGSAVLIGHILSSENWASTPRSR
ncbi:MAG: hypothetical protein AAF911_06920 [Planctomycetota bacterium]